jgi:two-component system, OmpR family, sensor kinase
MMNQGKALIKKLVSPKSLRYQLLTRILFILSVILLIIGSLQYFVMKDFLYKNEADTMRAKLMSLPRTLVINSRDQNGRMIYGENPGQRFLFMENFSLATITADGNFTDLLSSNGLPAPQLSAGDYSRLLQEHYHHQDIDYQIVTDPKGSKQLVIYRQLGSSPGSSINAPEAFLQMGTSVVHLQDTLMRQLLSFIVLATFALAAGVAMYFSVIRKTLSPLSNIVDSVEKINAGNLSERIPIHQGQEEIDRLSDSFNEMLQRLEASFEYERETKEQMSRFIADASHELRTPLTSIHGFLEVLLRGAANRPEQLYNALNSMHGESKRIIKLVEDLLLLAKLDRAPELQLSKTDLTELFHEMESQLRVLAGTRTVTFELKENISGKFDSDKLKQVILNLFHNAVQHTDRETGKIMISLDSIEQHAVFSIQDNGQGIDSEALSHVFDRFYRIDSSRTRKNGGAGLGLAITKSIVDAHGGRVEVDSILGAGATFTVYLPINKMRNTHR